LAEDFVFILGILLLRSCSSSRNDEIRDQA
jgi:hypothetical protein